MIKWKIPHRGHIRVFALVFILTFILFSLLFTHWEQVKAFIAGIFS